MKKIPTIFLRDHETHNLTAPNPLCDWVFRGEGRATRKYDGTQVMVDHIGAIWKRYEVKPGKESPAGFLEVDHDEVTGKIVGWLPIDSGPEDKYIREAIMNWQSYGEAAGKPPEGTYEACGPKIQGNPEHFDKHILVPHGKTELHVEHVSLFYLRHYLGAIDVEGIVWWHADGRMAKVKGKDFGIKRV